DSVIKANDAIGKGDGKDENKPEYQYGALGFAWKSFADYAESYKLANYKDYYQNSLAAYEKGIELSKRKNNLFLENAAKMAIHSDDYVKAEDYFKETLSLTAGDIVIYGELADLYEYNMHKSKAEVIAVYDKGISKALDAGKLTKRKAEYLKRVEGK
ncbi:MAG: hypothetical protein NT091_00195, partial [Candidatus Falkowbacteria bacterium]|nr:hypothetical protein [Candidatus Falkowbacteria bacterium]